MLYRPSIKDPDYIIIGSGSASWVLATRLSENAEVDVLLVEADGFIRTRAGVEHPDLQYYGLSSAVKYDRYNL